jgi:predicted secreted protein
MTWFSATVIFIISWWMVFLAALPIGVRGQHEDGVPEDGTEPGAPVHHMLPKKAFWATIGAVVVTFIAFLIGLSGLIRYPEVPWA